MPHIKIGFDKVPTPLIPKNQPLYDIIRGVPLRDASRNVLVIDSIVPLESGVGADNSTSVVLDSSPTAKSVKVIEQFPETSQVSSSLLGVPRSETQLSLFSDVSTYGLDDNIFEFYSFTTTSIPTSWYTRLNETYGNHYFPRLSQKTNEQALAVEAFPVNYTFPRGPRFEYYNKAAYERYRKFITLGNFLFREYKDNNLSFAKDKFLDPEIATTFNDEVIYKENDDISFSAIEKWTHSWMDMRDGLLFDPNGEKVLFVDGLGSDVTRPGDRASVRYFGMIQSKNTYRYQPGRISGFTFGFRCSTDEASVDNIIEWGIGNDTDQYVFQVRGASFNIVRRSTVPLPENVLLSQGLTLDDQVLKESGEPVNSNTIYETVIPRDNFNQDKVDGNGKSGYLLDPNKVTMYKIEFGWYGAIGAKFFAYVPVENGGARWVLMHNITIENSVNKPCLENPSFKFRYSLDIKNTSSLKAPQYLYKYGASCYIDGGDNDSSKSHSYISEGNIVRSASSSPLLGVMPKRDILNSDGVPKANKNNMYPSAVKASVDQLTELQIVEVEGGPGFGHHYTPSLHAKQSGVVRSIDISEDYKTISIKNGPELDIQNIDGNPSIIETVNKHNMFTGQKVRIDGVYGITEYNNSDFYVRVFNDKKFSIFHDSNLTNEVSTQQIYDSGGTALSIPIFREQDEDAKIINSLLYSTYINRIDERTASVSRIGISSGPYNKSKNETISKETKIGRDIKDLRDIIDTSNVRFTNFEAIAAANYPLTGDTIDVNFLNSTRRESSRQYCEFEIGITEMVPKLEERTNLLGEVEEYVSFENKAGIKTETLDESNYLSEAFTQRGVRRDRDGIELREDVDGYGIKMDMDYRIENPRGVNTGVPSSVRAIVEPRTSFEVEYTDTNPKNSQPGDYITFKVLPNELLDVKLIGGELGIGMTNASAQASGVKFKSNIQSYISNQQTGQKSYFVEVDSFISLDQNDKLWITTVILKDRDFLDINENKQFVNRKVFSFNPKPLYVVLRFRDSSEMNNVSITEHFPDGSSSFSPFWITNDAVDVINSGNSQQGLPAENYTSKDRLNSLSSTNGISQPLRPGVVKDSFYISPGTKEEISLDSIYGPDRTTLSTGLLNTKATFFTGKSIEDNSINLVDLSIISKE